MTEQILLSSKINDSLFKARERLYTECQEALEWITDITENEDRLKGKECEICGSDKKSEQHHIRGRKHGNEVMTVCHECHKILTNKQRLWDREWLEPESDIKGSFLIHGLIDVCELKHQRTGKEIYKLLAEELTEGFSYE